MPEYKVTYADGSTNNIRALEDQVKELTKDGGSYERIVVTKTDVSHGLHRATHRPSTAKCVHDVSSKST